MKRILIPMVMLLLAVLACGYNGSDQGRQTTSLAVTPTSIVLPTQAFIPITPTLSLTPTPSFIPITPTLSLTPTPSLTSVSPDLQGTPHFQPLEAISAENSASITSLARWGNGKINVIALSPDGQTLAAATTIGVALYDADTLALQSTWLIDKGVEALAFSPDGETLATGSEGVLQLWDVASGTAYSDPLQQGDFYDSIESLAYSPDGKWLAAGTLSGIRVYDPHSGEQIALLHDPSNVSYVFAVVFSPDGRLLVGAMSNYINIGGRVMLWDTATWQLQREFTEDGAVDEAGGLAFTTDGKMLAITGGWYYSFLWDLESGTSLQAKAADGGINYEILAVSPDGATLAGGSYYGILSLWDTSTGENRRDLQVEGLPLRTLVFAPHGQRLYAASTDGIRTWDLTTQSVAQSAINHLAVGQVISFSPDGKRLATLNEEEVIILDASNGVQLQSLPGEYYAAISPDWSLLAAVAPDDPQTLLLYDLASRVVVHRMFRGEQQAVHEMFFSPDGQVLAQLEFASEGSLLLWDTQNGSLLYSLQEAYSFLAFTPDGQSFTAVGTDTGEDPTRVSLQFWDVASGMKTESLPLGQAIIDAGYYSAEKDTVINSLAFSPDGSRMAVGINKLITLWDRSGTLLWVTEDDTYLGFCYLTFSPDGSVLAVGNNPLNPLILLNATNGKILAAPLFNDINLNGLAFSPDGTLLVTSGLYDGTVRFWGVRR
jgi:WD40 repeat protein